MYNEEAYGVALEETFVLRRESNVFRITERRERLAGEKPPEIMPRVFNEKKETSQPITRKQSHVSTVTRTVTRIVTRIIPRRTLFRAVYYITESPRAFERRRRRRRLPRLSRRLGPNTDRSAFWLTRS